MDRTTFRCSRFVSTKTRTRTRRIPLSHLQITSKHSTSTVQAPEQNRTNPADSLIPDSLIPDSLIPDSLIPDPGIQSLTPAQDADAPHTEPAEAADDLAKPQPKTKAKAKSTEVLSATDLINRFSVDPGVAADWLAVRKAKRAPLTETAMAGIEREAHAAGLAVSDAIRVCAEQGWQGFKADWYANLRKPPQTPGARGNHGASLTEQNRAAIAEAKIILFGNQQRVAQ